MVKLQAHNRFQALVDREEEGEGEVLQGEQADQEEGGMHEEQGEQDHEEEQLQAEQQEVQGEREEEEQQEEANVWKVNVLAGSPAIPEGLLEEIEGQRKEEAADNAQGAGQGQYDLYRNAG